MAKNDRGIRADTALRQALETVTRTDCPDVIERFVTEYPSVTSPEFLEDLNREIDDIQRTHRGDWWGLTRVFMLLRGYRDGVLDDAMFRCRVRDLLLLGPDDVRRKVAEHPELLGERADQLLRALASEKQAPGQEWKTGQIELRRSLLREIAFERTAQLQVAALVQEREFQRSGDLAALDKAVAARKYFLEDPGAPFVSVEASLANIQGVTRLLRERYSAGGALDDLNQAVAEPERVLAFLRDYGPRDEGSQDSAKKMISVAELRHALRMELANSLNMRFRELRERKDIDRALEILEDFVTHGEAGSRPMDRLTAQVNLAVALGDRYFAFKAPKDLERAIELGRQILRETASDSPLRPLRVNNLASALYLAFRDTGDRAALTEAITLQREVVKTEDAPFRMHALAALARSLDAATKAGEPDVQEPAPVFREACRLGLQLNVGAAMWAGMTWGREAWDRGDLDAAAEAYGYCAEGARLLFSRQSGESSQGIRLSQFREVAPRAAFALAHGKRVGEAAVAFELSRAQLLIQAIERGQTLRHTIDLDAEVPAGAVKATAAPARSAFDVHDISAAALGNPIVYLLSTDRGGLALLAHQGEITSIPLPELNTRMVEQRVRAFWAGMGASRQSMQIRALDDATSWLWDAAMRPMLDNFPEACEIGTRPRRTARVIPLARRMDAGPGTAHRTAVRSRRRRLLVRAKRPRTLRGSRLHYTADGGMEYGESARRRQPRIGWCASPGVCRRRGSRREVAVSSGGCARKRKGGLGNSLGAATRRPPRALSVSRFRRARYSSEERRNAVRRGYFDRRRDP